MLYVARRTFAPLALVLAMLIPASIEARQQPGAQAQIQDRPVIQRRIPDAGRTGALPFVRTELFFGTAAPGQAVTEEQFLAFLDAEVTPRFPDGLTLFKGHGRFTGKDGVLVKEDPFMVILLHPYDHFAASNKKIEEIRRVYKKQFQQESVLRVDYQFSVRVSF